MNLTDDVTAVGSAAIGYRQLALRLVRLSGPTLIWAAYLALIVPYAALRAIGAHTFRPYDLGKIEGALFGIEPTRFLQQHIYTHNLVWFDFAGWILHLSWFFLPFVFGALVMVFERRRTMEFFAWALAAYYLSDIFFIVFPVRPPWMEPGIVRILMERSFVHYTQLDDNPFAAFPSMHSCLPMVMTLFFFLRCERARFLGWFTGTFALLIGFAVVYLGEHWVLDVVAGYALAGGVAVLFMQQGLRRWYACIPGDPVGLIVRFNDAIWGKEPASQPDALPIPLEVPDRKAA